MTPPPAPTPVHARHDASAVVAATLRMSRDNDDDVAAAARLFEADYDCCGGRVVTMAASSVRISVATAAASAASQRRLHGIVDKDGDLVPNLSQAKQRRTPGRAPRTPPRSKRRDVANTPSRPTPSRLPRAVAAVVSSVVCELREGVQERQHQGDVLRRGHLPPLPLADQGGPVQ